MPISMCGHNVEMPPLPLMDRMLMRCCVRDRSEGSPPPPPPRIWQFFGFNPIDLGLSWHASTKLTKGCGLKRGHAYGYQFKSTIRQALQHESVHIVNNDGVTACIEHLLLGKLHPQNTSDDTLVCIKPLGNARFGDSAESTQLPNQVP